ncbi:ABC transporter ATP-binding protein [Umboniibacter marinipuniceus]|uniref:Putative ABC transport system ATP-binding protein n=1 Tax=Umboniibacter marinipuniceus TaxID=569599 RepID=A0A3M0AB68_9GAMM|nr:ABC transporter ATP-binding protein [Umboniibacter marinipuniceus]RMA80018.1 putative ABC transport system ATP-binding protein [Umboniibacter marinipuniceus]
MSSSPVIQLEQIVKSYELAGDRLDVLKGVNLKIDSNEYVALTGPSGSGKSTLMNILGCLDSPSEGNYLLAGDDVSGLTEDELAAARNQRIGFIFQSFNLLPRMSALDNVAQPLVFRGLGRKDRLKIAQAALERVGLGDRVDHLPNQLSGGQRQRVAVARALAGEPSILLADEPTGNLDSKTTESIMALFDELHNQGQTIIIVTHEPEIAAHCRREIVLRDGEIVKDVTKEPGHVL